MKKKKESKIEIEEVGMFDDFLIIDTKNTEEKKPAKGKKINLNNLKTYTYKDWTVFEPDEKQKKSRFSDLFEQIKEKEKKDQEKEKDQKEKEKGQKEKEKEQKEKQNLKNKEEDNKVLKKDDSLKCSSSLNLSLQTTLHSSTLDSKISEGLSISDSLLDINNIHKVPENKINVEQNKTEEELNLNVDINKVISLEDIRATIMIKNIPNKFNKDLLLSIINQNFKGTYDLFILPTDINKFKNFGYCFINFTSSYYIPYFYFMFNGKMWSSTNSKKVCELTYSKVQGKNDLLRHYPIKIVHSNEDALNVTPEQQYIIPNVYKLIFNKYFPNQKIEEKKFYFITKMPNQN